MDKALYIFNPQHDLALANYNPYYHAPKSALTFAHDLALLPLWYAAENADIMAETTHLNWLNEQKKLFNQTVNLFIKNSTEYTHVNTWGWNPAVRYKLLQLGLSPTCLPSNTTLDRIKELSHRQLAADGMLFLKNAIHTTNLPEPAVRLNTLDAVNQFAQKQPEIVLKAPYSGSGKGLYWNKGALTESLAGWCKRTIEKQGCVMGEKALLKVQDFAMEFHSDGQGHISFCGYSLFQTDDAGIYKSNLLLSNEAIECALERYISIETIRNIQHHLLQFFETHIIDYQGYFGVDMFIFKQKDSGFFINPCVEINMRMTMGLVARLFYDRFITNGKQGVFTIQHGLSNGELLAKHQSLTNQHPLIVKDSKIESGYLSLCPINESTYYSASVIIN